MPKNFDEATEGVFAELWREACVKEYANLEQHDVFTWVRPPPGAKMLQTTWAWRVKPDASGNVHKFKARICGRGYLQRMGLHFVQCSSPVGKMTTFRILMSEAARRKMDWCFVDIQSAYLMSSPKIVQFSHPPPGVSPPEVGMVWRLDRSLYGLKDSGRSFHLLFRKDLLQWGFKASEADPCLFIKRHKGEMIRVLLFVDDMAIFNDSTPEGRKMKKDFMGAIERKGYKYSNQADDNVYIGLTVKTVASTGQLVLTQDRYIGDLAAKHNLEDCGPVYVPAPGGSVSVSDCPEGDPKENKLATPYR